MAQKQKCSLKLYSNFLLANHNRYSGTELAKVSPIEDMAHDSVTRWLHANDFTPSDLWRQVKPLVDTNTGYLIGDDTLLEKPRSKRNELAKVQYSGNQHSLKNGICLVNLLWSDGADYVPIDYRYYDKARDDKTKNDHYLDMLNKAERRGFKPKYVLNDSWYGSVANMKAIDRKGWKWITNLKHNRQVSEAKGTYIPVSDLALADKQVKHVWLKEYGTVSVCKLVDQDGDITYLASNDLDLLDTYDDFIKHWSNRWQIEQMHRGIKQTTGIAKNYAIKQAP
ncbi:MAG: transposase [Actinobacteria bacterium]|nr:transposase [Actinomycetota bacterium]